MRHLLSILGALVAGFAGRLLWVILTAAVVRPNLQLYAALAVFSIGLLLIEGVASTLAAALTALGTAVGKYLPWMKGGAS